jgi:hypothetical protein
MLQPVFTSTFLTTFETVSATTMLLSVSPVIPYGLFRIAEVAGISEQHPEPVPPPRKRLTSLLTPSRRLTR